MTTHAALEDYLVRLERALFTTPASDRAEIILEIKSHVLDAEASGQSLKEILSALGEPETVANRYMLEKGLPVGRASRMPILKWLTIGFLGTFGIATVAALVLVWKFSPILEIDDKAGSVKLLGGAINLNGTSSVNGFSFISNSNSSHSSTAGSLTVKDPLKGILNVKFTNGKIHYQTSKNQKLSWDCKVIGKAMPAPKQEGNEIKINLVESAGIKCDVKVPAGMKTFTEGGNGKINFEAPRFHVDLKMDNAKVEIEPAKDQFYKYDVKIQNGRIDDFNSSDHKSAYEIKVSVVNGKIANEG